jgi:MAE_28990/MAE_18760-like HEPN
MFAQVFVDFNERVREVNLFFQVLSALDNDEIAIVPGTGPQVVTPGPPPADWGRMLKGAAYLVLYNLVEAFVRRGFQAVFEGIKNDGLCGIELIQVLRVQWVMQKNRRVSPFDGSPKVYMEIANQIISEVVDKKVAQLNKMHLPISGNLDADAIREVCMDHGVDHTTPSAAKGGSALTTVKKKRNALSHGDESFVECGRNLTASDLVQSKDEIVLFMNAILQNLRDFADNKLYKA